MANIKYFRAASLFAFAAISSTVDAQFVFERPHYDFGVVKAAGAVEHRFAFTATGDRPIEITDVRPSCGCLRTALPKAKFQPGESGAIPLIIHVASQAEGKKRFELTLTVRDPIERIVTLSAAADIQSDVHVEPSNLVVQLHDGQTSVHRITIRDRRPRPLDVTEAIVSNPAMTAKVLPVGNDRHERTIEVTIGAGLKSGRSTTSDSKSARRPLRTRSSRNL